MLRSYVRMRFSVRRIWQGRHFVWESVDVPFKPFKLTHQIDPHPLIRTGTGRAAHLTTSYGSGKCGVLRWTPGMFLSEGFRAPIHHNNVDGYYMYTHASHSIETLIRTGCEWPQDALLVYNWHL